MHTISSTIYKYQSPSVLFEMTYPRNLCTKNQETRLAKLILTHKSEYNFLLTVLVKRDFMLEGQRPDNACMMRDGETWYMNLWLGKDR